MSADPELFLGVDGGQSSTTAVIGDTNGKVIAWATAGPCNHVAAAEGRTKFLRVMRECLSAAASRAGLNPERPHFRSACLGMSGGPDDKAGLLAELLDADHLLVTTDATIALAGAMNGEPGIIVIAGTGSAAYGRNRAGDTARAGGWGYIFGDEGGAFDIVRQALRASLREHEGWGPRTALTPALVEAGGATDPNHLMHLFYTTDWPRSRVAKLAQVVDGVARAGDPVALDILHSGARQLALWSSAVRGQLWRDGEPAAVAPVGGVYRSEILLERFRMLIELSGNRCVEPVHGPAVGALLMAYETAGLRLRVSPAADPKF